MEIREATTQDAQAFLAHCRQLDVESRFMMLEPDERTTTVEQQAQRLQGICSAHNRTLLLAVEGPEVIGHVAGFGGGYRRNSRTVHVVVGVVQAYSGRGIATSMLQRLDEWAASQGTRRLELTVMTHNCRAFELYKRLGYEIEGIRKDSLYVDGHYVDEYAMAKILGG